MSLTLERFSHGTGIAIRDDLADLMLDERGMIRESSRAAERIFGYKRGELIWRHISLLFPQFSKMALVQDGQINQRLAFLCHCGHQFLAHGKNGNLFQSELHVVELGNNEKLILKMIVRPTGKLDQLTDKG